MFWAIYITSVVAAALALVDQLRRPQSAWVSADRDRGWWTTFTVLCGVFALGVVFALIYLIGVVPRFSGTSANHGGFRR